MARDRSPLEARRCIGPWLAKLEMRAEVDRIDRRLPKNYPSDGLVLIAALLSILGGIENKEARRGFFVFKELLFRKERIGRWVPFAKKIPPDRETILHITEGLYAYYEITGKSLRSWKVDPVQVVSALLEIKDYRTYISRLHGRGLTALGAMFHPNTLDRARKDMRGVFGDTSGYWKKTAGQVRVISDDD